MNPHDRRVTLSFDGAKYTDIGVLASGEGVSFSTVDETHVFDVPWGSVARQAAKVGRTEALQSRLVELEAELALRRRFGSDDYDEGAVLLFKGDFGGPKRYSYAAIKAGGRWHLTGAKAPSNLDWDGLVDFLTEAQVRKIRLVTDTERVA